MPVAPFSLSIRCSRHFSLGGPVFVVVVPWAFLAGWLLFCCVVFLGTDALSMACCCDWVLVCAARTALSLAASATSGWLFVPLCGALSDCNSFSCLCELFYCCSPWKTAHTVGWVWQVQPLNKHIASATPTLHSALYCQPKATYLYFCFSFGAHCARTPSCRMAEDITVHKSALHRSISLS